MTKQKMKNWEKIVAVAGVILITLLLCFVLTYVYRSGAPTTPPPYTPTISGKASKINDNISITITTTSSDEELSKFHGYVINNTGVFADNGTQIRVRIDDILNNETGNITFYDKDNNSKISTGDEFVIKGDLADKMDEFRLSWKSTGSTSLLIRRGVDY